MTTNFRRATRNDRLFNVPKPALFEAASCWLSRLALSQGVSLQELMTFFDLPLDQSDDLDLTVFGETLDMLREVCGLPKSALSVHERIVTSLNSIRPIGANYINRVKHKEIFRFCPLCLQKMETPYFPIHWRFTAWRWCPEHDCLLEDTCTNCGNAAIFPIDLFESQAARKGYSFLNRCQHCASLLSSIEPCFLQIGTYRRVSKLEDLMLRNGRALLAALYQGSFRTQGQQGAMETFRLKELENSNTFPTKLHWLTPERVRARSASEFSDIRCTSLRDFIEIQAFRPQKPFTWKVTFQDTRSMLSCAKN